MKLNVKNYFHQFTNSMKMDENHRKERVEVMEALRPILSSSIAYRIFSAGPFASMDEERIDLLLAFTATQVTDDSLHGQTTKATSNTNIWDYLFSSLLYKSFVTAGEEKKRRGGRS